jgi:hypothetical protein
MGRAGWQRDAAHTATLGTLQGRGSSQAKALEDLARLITEAAGRDSSDAVSVAWDADNRGLWVAVPDVMHGGHDEFMLTFRADGSPVRVRRVAAGVSPARDAFAGCAGFAPVTDQRSLSDAPKLPPMPAEVTEMLDRASDALTAYGRYASHTEAETGARDALADLADYVSAQYAPAELDRPATYVHPADPRRDAQAGAIHAEAAADAHSAGMPHDTSACGYRHPVTYAIAPPPGKLPAS